VSKAALDEMETGSRAVKNSGEEENRAVRKIRENQPSKEIREKVGFPIKRSIQIPL